MAAICWSTLFSFKTHYFVHFKALSQFLRVALFALFVCPIDTYQPQSPLTMAEMAWKAFLLKGARLFLQLSLFFIFLHFFGMPAVDMYEKRDIMLVENTKFTRGIPVPAVTIVVFEQAHFDFGSCYDLKTEDRNECINANSRNWSQILKGVVVGFEEKTSLDLTTDVVKEDFIGLFGNFVTLKMNLTIGPDDKKDQIYILLNSTYKYQIIIHDPEFFIYNENPAAIPMTTTYFDPRSDNTSYFYHLVLTEVMMMIWMMMMMMLEMVMIGTGLTNLR